MPKRRKPLSPEELAKVADLYERYKIDFMRHGPMKCSCGGEMTMLFVGHRKPDNEDSFQWEYRCTSCGDVCYS